MRHLKTIIAALAFLIAFNAAGKEVKRPESYNYNRALEAYNNNDYDEASKYFQLDVKQNPQSGYPLVWLALIESSSRNNHGLAMSYANKALKLLPKKDKEFVASAYGIRSIIYLALEDTVSSLNDLSMAIKQNPKSTYFSQRAQLYLEQEQYDHAEADYRSIMKFENGKEKGLMGLGRIEGKRGNHEAAIKYYNQVIKLAPKYSSGYSFRAAEYMQLKMWDECTDDIISALRIDNDDFAFYLSQIIPEEARPLMVSKLKLEAASEPNDASWYYNAGCVEEEAKHYEKAIEYYTLANERDARPEIWNRIASCHLDNGDFPKALGASERAINMDDSDDNYKVTKAAVLAEMGEFKKAMLEWEEQLKRNPKYDPGYGTRCKLKGYLGDFDGAMEDINMAIVIDPNDSYYHLMRGHLYMRQRKFSLAMADYNKVIELEQSPEDYNCIAFAYQGLGEDKKAIEYQNEILQNNPENATTFYNAACMYSRMNDQNNAFKYLKMAIRAGYNRFETMRVDLDFENIRNTPEFRSIVKRYCKKQEPEQIFDDDRAFGIRDDDKSLMVKKDVIVIEKPRTSRVPFTNTGGVKAVKCSINGLPLSFIFDTGAATVSISMVEATFMYKNGYIDRNDIVGKQYFTDANGYVSEGTVIVLREVEFGGFKLTNVRASVVANQKAPLLLGQSVLGRLGKIEIDNKENCLKITH